MKDKSKDSERIHKLEKYFKNSIKMAIQDMVSWSALVVLLIDMAPNVAECQLLIKILLKELEIMHKQKQIENISDTIQEEQAANDDVTVYEIADYQRADNEKQIQETKAEIIREQEEIVEVDKYELITSDETQMIEEFSYVEPVECLKVFDKEDNDEINFTERFNLKDFYTFVGNSKVKVNKTEMKASNHKLNQRKPQDQISINEKEDQEFEAKDEQSEVIHDKGKQKEFECTVCLKLFSNKGNLNRHGRIHSKEKSYECQICKKRFVYSHHLKNHEIIHSGEKPFKCKKCNKCFNQQSALKYHEQLHTLHTKAI